MSIDKKFTDDFRTRRSFANEFLVVCPRCSKKAKVSPTVIITAENLYKAERKIVCIHCGLFKKKFPKKAIALHVDKDWFFELPLYYVIKTNQGNLYAYNDEHLDYLEKFISSKIRERVKSEEYGWSNQSQISRLPKWVKSSKNRLKLLLAIKKINISE